MSAETHDPGRPHLINGEFQSDKYPTCPRGKVPLSVSTRLRLLNAALSEWIAARTDLPIDFQFQPYRDMPQFKGQPRNAMGILIECESETDRAALGGPNG